MTKIKSYPKILTPTEEELFLLKEETIKIPKCIIKFDRWLGDPIKETFGGKPIVCVDGKPMFAELAIMNSFIKSG